MGFDDDGTMLMVPYTVIIYPFALVNNRDQFSIARAVLAVLG
jgi:hypothetical protein